MSGKLYHMGFRGRVARSTLADANESHDWRIYADFAQVLIGYTFADSMAVRMTVSAMWRHPRQQSC